MAGRKPRPARPHHATPPPSRRARQDDDPRVGALFAAPPDRFVAERDALARALAEEGDARASRVRGLRRPTRRVWALNLLAREDPAGMAALLGAGERLRAAHAAALRGAPGAGLRRADEEMSARLDALVTRARLLLETAGHPPDHAALVALRSDLRTAAAAGAEDAARLAAGRLERPPSPADLLGGGLGAEVGAVPAPDSPAPAAPRRDEARRGEEVRRREEARRRTEERRRAEEGRRRLGRERQRARRAAEAARREATRRSAAALEAEARARTARDAAAAAQRARDEAERALARAEEAWRAGGDARGGMNPK